MHRYVLIFFLGMARIVHVHHMDKEAFLRGNIEPDPDEIDLVFDRSPTYAEVLQQIRVDLNWMDPSDVVELEGRHNVGFGMHNRWKTMRISSEQRWFAYKEVVAESQDKALELFATKKVDDNMQRSIIPVASPYEARSPPPMNQEELTEPPLTQQDELRTSLSPISKNQDEVLEEHNDDYGHNENEVELHDNIVGDLDKYITQENMEHDIPYTQGYASDSDDDG